MKEPINLETVNPQGRLDVVGYKIAEHVSKMIEANLGVGGIWDNLKPHINNAAVRYLGNVELPIEAKIIMGIVQANQGKLLERMK